MVFIPIADDNPTRWIRYHYATFGIVAACVAVFLLQLSGGERGFERSFYSWGVIPSVLLGPDMLDPRLAAVPAWATLITSQFLHGSWLHLGGNMLFLWVFGDNIEDSMGHLRFLVFYLLCGAIAALAFAASDTGLQAPTIGASGAVAGVLGAYFVLHPRVHVLTLVWLWPVRMPAWILLGVWIGMEIFNSVFLMSEEVQVAFVAHVAGFVAGAVLVFFFRRRDVPVWNQDRTPNLRMGGVRIRQRGEMGPWGQA